MDTFDPMTRWDGRSRLHAAVLVDVDGTLASAYRNGKRELRPSALGALDLLSRHAPVFLWSVAGSENGARLLEEFPVLRQHVQASWSKSDFPLDKVDHPFCIDDLDVDAEVTRCRRVILGTTWDGGEDSGELLDAARVIIEALEALQEIARSDETPI